MILLGVLCAFSAQALFFNKPTVALEERFLNPPAAAKPWVYWFWMDGNVTKEGITADLEAMDRAGVGGALMMGVGLRTPPGKVDFNSPLYREMYAHAAAECVRLGMQLTLHQCDGWATAGGPWITPDRSMKMLVWTSQTVEGAGPIKLEQPLTKEEFYEDVAVVAIPASDDQLSVTSVTVDGAPRAELTDGNDATGIAQLRDVVIDLGGVQTVSAVQFHIEERFYRLGYDVPTTLEVSEDGQSFEPAVQFDLNVSLAITPQKTLTVSFAPRQARFVRMKTAIPTPGKIGEVAVFATPRVIQDRLHVQV